jgi:hypothetical protein
MEHRLVRPISGSRISRSEGYGATAVRLLFSASISANRVWAAGFHLARSASMRRATPRPIQSGKRASGSCGSVRGSTWYSLLRRMLWKSFSSEVCGVSAPITPSTRS